MPSYDNILLVGWGGPTEDPCPSCDPPTCKGHAWCYIRYIIGDDPRHEARVDEVAAHYEALGGYSPFNRLTLEQADCLREALHARGVDLPLRVGMRNWTPYVSEVLQELKRTSQRRALAVILAPHQSSVSWERYQETVEQARRDAAIEELQVDYLESWYEHPGFIEAITGRIEEQAEWLGAERFERAELIFTAHSIPRRAAADGRYVPQFQATARAAAARLGRESYHVAYQSEPDNTPIPWLGPNVNTKIRDLAAGGARDVIVAPIGFLCDHIEVLYDLDREARETAAEVGVGFCLAGTVGSHPAFIQMLADLIARRIGS